MAKLRIYEVIVKADPLGTKDEVVLSTEDRMKAMLQHVEDKFGYGVKIMTYEVEGDNKVLVSEEPR